MKKIKNKPQRPAVNELQLLLEVKSAELDRVKRELEIEAALEKVRAKVMAMNSSKELNETSLVFGEQLRKLGINWQFSYFWLIETDKDENTFWITWPDNKTSTTTYSLEEADDSFRECILAWQRQDKIHSSIIPPEGVAEWLNTFERITADAGGAAVEIMQEDNFRDGVYYYDAMIKFGSFGILSNRPINDEEKNIQCRFAVEFERAYTRFLDLQKAEAHAREAKIESALERVRSKTMAMQKSEELDSVIKTVYSELKKLDVSFDRCFIMIFDEQKGATWWMGSPEDDLFHQGFYVQYHTHPPHLAYLKGWEERQQKWEYLLGGQIKKAWDEFIFSKTELSKLPPPAIQYMKSFEQAYLAASFESFGCMTIGGPERLNEVSFNILNRFAKVFDQTYRRFLDLQNAEAKAREAQIELGLERVRARAMAMQKTDELKELIAAVSVELGKLDFVLDRCFINIIDTATMGMTWWMSNPETSQPLGLNIKYHEYKPYLDHLKAWQERQLKFQYILEGQTKRKWDKFLFTETELCKLPEAISANMKAKERVYLSSSFNNFGYLSIATLKPLSDEQFDIMLRFAKVFDLTYTRFNDLQRAEAQTRESLIELGLERVRARAMAMQKSGELKDLIKTVSSELGKLDLVLDRCFIMIYDSKSKGTTWWMAGPEKDEDLVGLFVKYHEHPPYLAYIKAWKERRVKWQYVLEGAVKKEWDRFIFSETDFAKLPEQVVSNMKSVSKVYLSGSFNNFGCLSIATPELLTDEQFDILLRFAKVFDLTYTRFNDLQKAEAQTREAQIEVSLERVRSKAMAMHKTEDLTSAVSVIFDELDKLQLGMLRCGIGILDRDNESGEFWSTSVSERGRIVQVSGDESMNIHPLLKNAFNAWLKQKDFSYTLEGEDLSQYYKAVADTNFKLPESQSIVQNPEDLRQYYHIAVFPEGGLYAFRDTPFPDEAKSVMKRFAFVFNLTYKRFLDLQRAEAQAREAKIETALEKVRSRSLAMHKSDELEDVIMVVSEQLQQLQFRFHNASFVRYNEQLGLNFWLASPGQPQPYLIEVPYLDNPVFNRPLEALKNGVNFIADVLTPEENHEWLKHLVEHSVLKNVSEDEKRSLLRTEGFARSLVLMKHIMLVIGNYAAVPYTDEQNAILKRFGNVFEQAYTRFLDLQKAEAQAKEAKIEASLERVRASAMAMHSSEDLASTIGAFYNELRSLGVTPRRCGVGLMDKETRLAELSTMNTTEDGESIEVLGTIKMSGHPVLEGVFDHWLLQKEFHAVLRGSQIKEYYHLLRPQIQFPDYPHDLVQYGYYFMFPEGDVYSWTEEELSEQELQIFRRFTSVLSLTYKRYKDLRQAEAQAREAKVEVALERIRARAFAMQTSTELLEVARTLREQMGLLGQSELEASVVHLYYENDEIFDSWLAFRPPGSAAGEVVTHTLQFRADDCELTREFLDMYRSDAAEYTLAPKGKKLDDFLEIVFTKSPDIKMYWGNNIPETRYYHFSDFSGGSLLMVSNEQPSQESINLQRRAASVFDLAYRRHLDLKEKEEQALRLKQEKERLEKTLEELQTTQKQLIQSEKMASLGELTAGIAHEIQNPLNFVNNFSDVSNELLEEMKIELAAGNAENAVGLVEEVKQNLEKILHHGRRADAIVKGMLQHSRSSSGQKEMTDINALADEYLRLAYHGLRAKDKSFNAKFETSFDNAIGKISVIPQDIGRVLLNLINNAFYAVSEKQKSVSLNPNAENYEPTVTVSTKKLNDRIEISVKDNGYGIPSSIKEKIFQPFFTTKPTGQGTGLGLSLSYDIVKAHQGEIMVKSQAGESTEFIVQLGK